MNFNSGIKMLKRTTVFLAILSICLPVLAQDESPSIWDSNNFDGLEFRAIGPAFMSGRIADIAIHPENENVWYVGVASGGVWRTRNAGVTWTPIFEEENSYSIGCVTIDPNDPNIIWVGTGENVGGRHIGFGDGVYRSRDGGDSWENVGLPKSEHVSKIIVHPYESNTVWVASQGPLWSKGGERGVYKTTDGGNTWKRTLGDAEWTGATDLAIDPNNPNRLYAATWQRHRTVAALMSGGPGSGLHRSDDGGDTWERLTNGLPDSNFGKIGLAISPQNPNTIYAAIELDRRKGGVFRSTDGGLNWEKRSDTVSGGTGPHYYQELYASPHAEGRIYLMDVRMQVSNDGGKTFTRVNEEHKHSDNHALAFRKSDPNYLLAGSDGGLYETFDLAKNWRYIDNLPLTQFYKVALDDAEPFFNIYGGTQDNASEGGPSRTDNVHGIQNMDWRVILDWDGHQPATEPGNPDIVYAERQEGFLSRIDMSTGEVVDIQPQPAADEDYERFNWDAPILVSPHQATRLYFASQRVWRSDNRGDKWTAISGDLTRNENRLELPIMGDTQSWDNAWDVLAMSNYNTITSISESPQQEGLIYVGTDDGLIQVTEDGGKNWRKIEISVLPNCPGTAFVNDIKADLHDPNTVYVCLDNHKYGDYRPYLYKSSDRGKSWEALVNNLPEPLLVWRLVQDHKKKELLFIGTEFGIYFSVDGGEHWAMAKGNVPTIPFRDLAIHRRDDDLVGASFGRGFFVFDDINVFREISTETLEADATLFQPRKTWWYFPRPKLSFDNAKGDQGASHFVAPNPPFGAVFTYYLNEGLKSKTEIRQQQELDDQSEDRAAKFPGWDALDKERRETRPQVWLTVRDAAGNVVRRINGPVSSGFHRVAWNLRYPLPDAVPLKAPPAPPWPVPPNGLYAAPGKYTVEMATVIDGKVSPVGKPQAFDVVPLRKGALDGASAAEVAKFWRAYEKAVRSHSALQIALGNSVKRINRMSEVIANSQTAAGELDQQVAALRKIVLELDARLNGSRSRQEIGEKFNPIIQDRLFAVSRGVERSSYGPTATHRESLNIANREISEVQKSVSEVQADINKMAKQLFESGGPWIEGTALPKE